MNCGGLPQLVPARSGLLAIIGQFGLRGRAAWVYDYDPHRAIGAAFQTLPGASFIVNGATRARDAALTSVAAAYRLGSGVSLIGKIDGEFAGTPTPTPELARSAACGEAQALLGRSKMSIGAVKKSRFRPRTSFGRNPG